MLDEILKSNINDWAQQNQLSFYAWGNFLPNGSTYYKQLSDDIIGVQIYIPEYKKYSTYSNVKTELKEVFALSEMELGEEIDMGSSNGWFKELHFMAKQDTSDMQEASIDHPRSQGGTNVVHRKYQVFVSSTYEDLTSERQAVIHTLLDNDCIPVGMEQFPSSGMKVMEYIEKVLIDCDYYLLIVAGRYGSVDENGKGITEKEFDYAKSANIPILVFSHGCPESLPMKSCEDTDAKKEKLKLFREKVLKGTLAKYYTNKDALCGAVATSINKAKTDTPRPGWVRGQLKIESENAQSSVAVHSGKVPPSSPALGDIWIEPIED